MLIDSQGPFIIFACAFIVSLQQKRSGQILETIRSERVIAPDGSDAETHRALPECTSASEVPELLNGDGQNANEPGDIRMARAQRRFCQRHGPFEELASSNAVPFKEMLAAHEHQ